MIGYKYPNKDRRVLIFKPIRREEDDGTITTEKHYLTAKGTYIKAYMIDITVQSSDTPTKIPTNQTTFIVNWRDEVTDECYIEYCGETFQIRGVDGLDYRKTEMRLLGQLTTGPSYDTVTYGG